MYVCMCICRFFSSIAIEDCMACIACPYDKIIERFMLSEKEFVGFVDEDSS